MDSSYVCKPSSQHINRCSSEGNSSQGLEYFLFLYHTVVIRSVAVGADDPRSSTILRCQLFWHHRVPVARTKTTSTRVLPWCTVSIWYLDITKFSNFRVLGTRFKIVGGVFVIWWYGVGGVLVFNIFFVIRNYSYSIASFFCQKGPWYRSLLYPVMKYVIQCVYIPYHCTDIMWWLNAGILNQRGDQPFPNWSPGYQQSSLASVESTMSSSTQLMSTLTRWHHIPP